MNKLCFIILLICLASGFPAYADSKTEKTLINLTEAEHAWLKEHPVIRLGESTHHPPFLMETETGKLQGIIVDYFKILEDRLDTRFEIVKDDSGNNIQKAVNKEIDGVAYMSRIVAGKVGLHSVRSNMNLFATVFGPKDKAPDINSLDDLKGLRVAYFRDVIFLRNYLKQHAEELKIIEADNPLQAMQYVVEGKADVMLGFNINSYLLSKYMLPGLTVLHISNVLIVEAGTGIRPDWPELVPILNKAIDSIPLEKIRTIMSKWGAISIHQISLNEKERAWLKKHPVIRVGADPAWAPLEFRDESGAIQGVSVDFLKRIREMLGIEFEFIDKPTWGEMLEMAKNGELDLLSSVRRTSSREQFLSFTDSYIDIPVVIFSGPELTFIGDLEELYGRRVAVVKGYAIEELLTADHPDIFLVPTESTIKALHLLAQNEVDVFVGNILTTSYYLGQLGYSQIKVAGDTPYIYNQTMGVRKDWPVLTGILQKALDAIPPHEKSTIRHQWVAVKYEHGFNYSLLLKILGLFIIVFGSIWIFTLLRQIKERKKVEDSLRLQSAIMMNMDEGVNLSRASDFIIVYTNPKFEKMFGYSSGELIGKHVSVLNAPTEINPQDIAKTIKESIDKTSVWRGEIENIRKDGTIFWSIANISMFDHPDHGRVFVSVQTDVTERKQFEEERQKSHKLESIGILAGGIAHDFNNLLSGILNNVYLLKMNVDRESKEYKNIESAEKAIYRATNLTRQLLTFSSGGNPIKKTASIIEIIKESADFVLRGSNVKCEYIVADNLRPVEVDEGQMNQVIHNLMLNANQAMPEGGTIRISTENYDFSSDMGLPLKDGKYVKVVIQDQGTGISEEHLQKLFDPYFTTKDMGRGLGLSITYSIIKQHNGNILAESELGIGTTFTIYLPASEKLVEEKYAVESASVNGEGKVLIMDDEEILRESIGELLTMRGFEVEYAKEGEEAIELYKESMEASKPFKAVVLDLTIRGGIGGKEVVKKLHEIDPDVKAIVSSGYSNDPVMANYKEYGFSDVFCKASNSPDELCEILNKVIKE